MQKDHKLEMMKLQLKTQLMSNPGQNFNQSRPQTTKNSEV